MKCLIRNLASVFHNDDSIGDSMNLKDVVCNINDEQTLLLELYRELIYVSPFAHRKMIRGLTHDDNAIAQCNHPRDFESLLLPAGKQRDFVVHINAVPQAEISEHIVLREPFITLPGERFKTASKL